MKQRAILSAAILLAAVGALSACGGGSSAAEGHPAGQSRLGSEGGVSVGNLFGGDDHEDGDAGPAEIGVNAFLWRASLDTLNFMPLLSEDPFGGVIITDWYADPSTPNERFKATVYILDTRLRADALNVSVFRQTQANGAWADAAVTPDTAIQIENAILTRARQLRLSSLAN